ERVSRLNRRRLLGGGAAGVAGIGLGAAALNQWERGNAETTGTALEPFYSVHQAGIATAPQSQIAFVALDLRPGTDRADIIGLLKIWTDDAARLTQGRAALADTEP